MSAAAVTIRERALDALDTAMTVIPHAVADPWRGTQTGANLEAVSGRGEQQLAA